MSASSDPTAAVETADEVVERSVLLPKHLHARPAGEIAQAAARNKGTTIEIIYNGKRVNARSVLAVMALGAVNGQQVDVAVTGPGAQQVSDEIVAILLAPEDE